MKRTVFTLFTIILLSNIFATETYLTHAYNADYSLFPQNKFRAYYENHVLNDFQVNYSVQAIYTIPRSEVQGYSCEEILKRLDQMGGLDKECFGVSYIDGNTGERKPIFKKSSFTLTDVDGNTGELYVKDKAAGGLYFDVTINKYNDGNNYYIVYGLLNRSPTNFFVRGIKKNEASIFVLIEEAEAEIKLYALMQSKYSPANHRFLKSFVENAVAGRVLEIENWFYRMLCCKE